MLSVVICTHNPKPVLFRTLEALRTQIGSNKEWELLVVDNASNPSIEQTFDTSWHPQARIVREEELGIVFARVRGMREATGELILFVDDDNILAKNFIETGLQLAELWPQIGCFGGQLLPEFEETPPSWTINYWKYLAVRPLERDLWTNVINQFEVVVPTAGMFVRRKVFEKYLDYFDNDERRSLFGPRGEGMAMRCEDLDIGFTACDIGLGLGLFTGLKLTHVIPPNRLTPEYLARLMEGVVCSTILLRSLRETVRRPAERWSFRLLNRWREWRLPRHLRLISEAENRGRKQAFRILDRVDPSPWKQK